MRKGDIGCYVTVEYILAIYVTAYGCACGLKKLGLRSGSHVIGISYTLAINFVGDRVCIFGTHTQLMKPFQLVIFILKIANLDFVAAMGIHVSQVKHLVFKIPA